MSLADWTRSVSDRYRDAFRAADTPPYADLQPTVEWQVNGFCNYDCIYCIQSVASRVGVPEESTIRAIIGEFARLPGEWEIKMSGGEPFAFKGFIGSVVPQLVERTQHLISVLTNFSAPLDVLERFSQLTAERLRIVSASFHPDTADLDAFVDKAIAFSDLRGENNPHSSFVVNVVLVPGSVAAHFQYQERLADAGIRYFPQLMKIKGGVYPYNEEETALIARLTGDSHDPKKVNRSPNYKGVHCESGRWYFTVDQTGEAYSCRTGKRFLEVNDRAHMGSLVDGSFELRKRGGPCPYEICPCTVPVNRGIVRLTHAQSAEVGDGD